MGSIDISISDDLLALVKDEARKAGKSTRAWAAEAVLVRLGRARATQPFEERLAALEAEVAALKAAQNDESPPSREG